MLTLRGGVQTLIGTGSGEVVGLLYIFVYVRGIGPLLGTFPWPYVICESRSTVNKRVFFREFGILKGYGLRM